MARYMGLAACAVLVLFSVTLVAADLPTCSSLGVIVKRTSIPETAPLDDYHIDYASKNSKVVFVRIQNGEVYRSSDEGDTWVKQTVNSKMPGIESSTRKISRITVSAFSSRPDGYATVYLGNSETIWVSEDSGITYRVATLAPVNVYRITPHPNLKDVAIAQNATSAWLTRDSGRTWLKLTDNARLEMLNWGFAGQHENRIYAIRMVGSSSQIGDLVISEDFFHTYEVVHNNIWWYTLRNADDIIAGQWQTNGAVLTLSDDAGKNWRVALFPAEGNATVLGWHPFDTSEDSVFIGLLRGSNPAWADVFKSNSFDKDFSNSLRHISYPDFTRFYSVEGIFVANQYVLDDPFAPPNRADDIRTKISYNKGGKWYDLRPPTTEFDGRPYNCNVTAGCALHLHGFGGTGIFSWFYSTPASLGLMFANGNVGTRLSSKKDDINAYFSYDAGLTWEEIGDGPYVPEFGDMGGIVVAVDEDDPVNHVLFHDGKLANGRTVWTKCQFNDGQLEKIRNIRVNPNWDAKKFIMYGSSNEINGAPLIYSLDFAPIMQNCKAEDFEEWTPTDEHGGCVLGEKDTYKRRKEGHNCWYGEQIQRLQKTESCPCTYEDYECDFCFEFDDTLNNCVFVCDFHQDNNSMPVPPLGSCNTAKDTYFSTNLGWRQVEDDRCDVTMPHSVKKPNGLAACSLYSNRPPTPTSSPSDQSDAPIQAPSSGTVSSGLIVAIIVIVFVILLAAVVFVLITKNNRFRAFFGLRPIGAPTEDYSQLGTSLQVEEEDDAELGQN